ncbi:alkaline phosphatase [Chitinophaga sp. GCM10012297]|uniref:alkaline phosphatase n=1 Tax=Chitinophaga TaxID=79328 RepID=UPI001F2EE5DE|nr:alkaline phosphatase [Chitinophaga chungangae]
MFIHSDQPDGAGHGIGHDIPGYYEQVHKNDVLLGRIVQAVKDAGIWDNSVPVLSSDHGGINKGHGGKTMVEMQIPWIFTGKGIKKGTK